MSERELYAKAVEKFGETAQLGMVIEEASEIIKAVSKILRNEVDPSQTNTLEIVNLAEEAADMEIMLGQIRAMIGDEIVDREKRRKLDKLAELVKGVMEVLRSERVNDGKAELRLHFSMPDGSMVSVTHRVKIETEVDPPESQFTSGAKLFESVLQERADEWISSIGEEVADAMRALSELRGGDE